MKHTNIKRLLAIAGIFGLCLLLLWFLTLSRSEVPRETAAREPLGPKAPTEQNISGTPSPVPSPTPALTPTPSPSPAPSPTVIPTVTPTVEKAPENEGTAMISPPSSQENSVFSRAAEIWTPQTFVFIGDSRTHAMAEVTRGSGTWIYKDGAGYDWMVDTAFPEAEKTVGEGTAVIIAMGVNDVYHCSQYIAAINDQAERWEEKGAKVFFASVGPVTSDPYVTNEEILRFNTEMFHNLDTAFLDVYNHLAVQGFATTDGIHYDSATTRSVYQFLMDQIS